MCGHTLNSGAVTNVHNVKNPILAAQMVMRYTPHRLISGEHVEELAQIYKLEICDKDYFVTKKRYDQFVKAKKEGIISLEHGNDSNTVGAVARDQNGNLAAATSTGGLTLKHKGRVSDTAILGAGTYANNKTLAISATGTGDEFIRHVAAYDVHAQLQYANLALDKALQNTLDKISKTGGEGGFIAIDKDGNIFMPFNSSGMFRGSIKHNETKQIKIFKEE
jgi:L-asparaginase / beta-aspartyl-peptidase